MFSIFFLIVLPIVHDAAVLSYNLPKLCPNASWNSSAVVFHEKKHIYDIFVATNNTVYATDTENDGLLFWPNGDRDEQKIRLNDMRYAYSLFVTTDGSIYVNENEEKNPGKVQKWIANKKNDTYVMSQTKKSSCYSLFVDINNNLYCSQWDQNIVVRISLNGTSQTKVLFATYFRGKSINRLHHPAGIFVDVGLNLYVADSGNGRIQLFKNGSQIGETKVGTGAPNIFELHTPMGVVLDGGGTLFIVDHHYNCIIMSNEYGDRDLPVCDKKSKVLKHPSVLRFDSDGNIFVVDKDYKRIQKFYLISNSCNKTTSTSVASTTSSKSSSSTTSSTSSPPTTSSSSSSSSSTATTITTPTPTTAVSIITTDGTTTVYSTELVTTSDPATFYPTTSSSSVLNNICAGIKPCHNNGTCVLTNETAYGFVCHCPPTHNGTYCENDIRLCQPNTCLNNGICKQTSAKTFVCKCLMGWTGRRCRDKVDYCKKVRCLNGGSCLSLTQNFTCRCIGPNYSGRYCENKATRIIVLQMVSKSFAYIAILFLVAVGLFIVTLDVLKYVFGIDVTQRELEEVRRERQLNRANASSHGRLRRRINARSS